MKILILIKMRIWFKFCRVRFYIKLLLWVNFDYNSLKKLNFRETPYRGQDSNNRLR